MRCVVIVINRIIQTYTYTAAVIARSAKRDAAISRKGRRTARTRISSNTCPRRLTAEKTSATETKAIIHPLPQKLASRGSLPYTTNPNTCQQGLTAAPAHLPAVAHRREIPCGRNESNHTPITPNTRQQGLPAVHDHPKYSPAVAHCRASPLACGGSLPRKPLRQKRKQSYTHYPKYSPAGAPCLSAAAAHRFFFLMAAGVVENLVLNPS